MADEALGMIEVHPHVAIVDRLQMPRRIVLFEDLEIPVPLFHGLGIEQEVVLVGQ